MAIKKGLFLLSLSLLSGCEFFESDQHEPGAFHVFPPEPVSNRVKTLSFNWEASTSANHYTLCLYETSSEQNCDPLLTNLGALSASTYVSTVLREKTTFFVLAENSKGKTASNELSLTSDMTLPIIGYTKASNTDASDQFGVSLSLSENGNLLVVGAIGESSGSAGIGGNQADNSSTSTGAAYVFQRTEEGWTQSSYLKPSNPDPSDLFGYAVALSDDGNTLAISALNEASAGIGINGNQTDNSAALAGAVYVFVKKNDTWQQQAYIKASNTNSLDGFGFAVALSQSGDRLAVSAPEESSMATGVGGAQSDNSAFGAGAVYIFDRVGNSWTQSAYVKPSNTDGNDNFGYDIALNGDGTKLLVGAPGEDANAAGVNDSNSADNTLNNSGAAYVFREEQGTWSQMAYLKASTPGGDDEFGHAVTINQDGTKLAISALKEDSASLTNGNELDNSATDAGAVYVFHASNNTWVQRAYLKPPNADSNDTFGKAIDMNSTGDLLAVGAPKEQSNALGINGETQANTLTNAGAVYLFEQSEEEWSFTDYYKATNTDAGDNFGETIALEDSNLSVGAVGEASNAQGIDGVQTDNSKNQAGAVYLF